MSDGLMFVIHHHKWAEVMTPLMHGEYLGCDLKHRRNVDELPSGHKGLPTNFNSTSSLCLACFPQLSSASILLYGRYSHFLSASQNHLHPARFLPTVLVWQSQFLPAIPSLSGGGPAHDQSPWRSSCPFSIPTTRFEFNSFSCLEVRIVWSFACFKSVF